VTSKYFLDAIINMYKSFDTAQWFIVGFFCEFSNHYHSLSI